MSTDKALVGREILTFKSEGHDDCWIACWVRRDVLAQGPTEVEAVNRLFKIIAFEWIMREEAKAKNELIAELEPPPVEVLAEWLKSHNETHGEK